MNLVHAGYEGWASQYDEDLNKTRDLEGRAMRIVLGSKHFQTVLELGCGTGKNTVWLNENDRQVTAVDFSEAMLAKAREKIRGGTVTFVKANITQAWPFAPHTADLICFSLVLEHIMDLNHIFREAIQALVPGGAIYIGELHPYKQYAGSAARYNQGGKEVRLPSYTHPLSEYTAAAHAHGLFLEDVQEWFDQDAEPYVPRVLTLLFRLPAKPVARVRSTD